MSQKEEKVLVVNICSEALKLKVNNFINELGLTHVDFISQNHNENNIIDINQLYKDSYEVAFDQLIDYGDFPLKNKQSIARVLLDQTNRSLWYYFRFMLLYKFRKRVFEVLIINELEKLKSSYDRLILFHESEELDSEIKSKYRIESLCIKNSPVKNSKLIPILKFLILTFSRFIVGFTSLFKIVKAKHIFLSDASASQKVLSIKSLNIVQGDHFTEYFQEYIEDKEEILNVSEFYPPSLGKANELQLNKGVLFSKHKNSANIETLLYLQLFNPFFYVRAIKNVNKIKNAFNTIEKTSTDNYLDNVLLKLIMKYKRLSYFVCIRKSALHSIFKLCGIKSIISANEHNVRAKSIMEVGEQFGVKSFGIQHGVVHPKHLHYIFSKNDAKYKPFPDITFVWGDYWKNVLLKNSNYQDENLKVVGQLRTDIIPKIKQWAEREKASSKYTVLYPSQPLYVGEEKMRERLTLDFLKLTIDFPEIEFIVKPHPFEKDCKAYFENIAKRINAKNYKVINNDLYKLLALSDLVMVYNSTVGAEAVYFDKPLIVMNYSDNDFSGFIDEGVAAGVESYEQLKTTIQNAIKNDFPIGSSSRSSFVGNRAFIIDGKCSERIFKNVTNT